MNQKSEIIDVINSGNTFVILGHVNPDGDSLGSMLGLSLYLREQAHKIVYVPAPIEWPTRYIYLEKHRNGDSNPPIDKVDAIIILDCSATNRADWGNLNPAEMKDVPQIVIDHHDEGAYFGDYNWIDTKSAAVGEMIFELLTDLGAEITPQIAEALYSAIMTDTGRFTFSCTTARSLAICSELVSRGGIKPSLITANIYSSFSEEYLRNIGIALYNSRIYNDSRIVLLTLDKASVRSFSTTFNDTEGIVDLAMSVRGVELAALFKEISRNVIRISLRSRGRIDVGAIAVELGGGGHHNAAGCTLTMPLSLSREVILDKFETALDNVDNV